jgi:hypothetical protein
MVNIEQMIERISKNVNCSVDALNARMASVLEANKAVWLDAGKTDDECNINALRIAGRQIKSEGDRLKRSGATLYEGMFVSVPRYKDWAQLAYKKAATSITESAVADAMVDDGMAIIYEDNNDGTYTKKYNPSLARGDAFESGSATTDITELPKNTFNAGDGIYFHLVWDKVSPTFPSGDKNFKYGNARPLSEKDRQTMFLGRVAGEGEVKLYNFRFNGALAETELPTFVAGKIAMRPAKNGTLAYGKAGVSAFQADETVQSIFSDSPDLMVAGLDEIKVLENGFQDIEGFVNGLTDKERWDALVAVMAEVVHIDPRDNGGYVITTGDLDIMSTAGTVDLYISKETAHLVDFAVGSTLMVVGQPYISREGEAKLVNTGWWCAESLSGAVVESGDVEGWD